MSKRVLQTHADMNYYIREYGCNFRSILAMCETHCKVVLTPKQILDIYRLGLQADDCVCFECSVGKNIHRIFSIFGKVTKVDLYGYQVGVAKQGKPVFWNDKYSLYNHTVLEYTTKHRRHCCEGDKWYNLVWNPDPRVEVSIPDSVVMYFLYTIDNQVLVS